MRKYVSSLILVAIAAMVGCTESGPARTPVKGTVKAPDGKPVEAGNLVFVPVTTDANAPSAPATAAIKSDGTFEVTGGAVAGKHKVMYEAPHIPSDVTWDGKGAPPAPPKSPYDGMKVKQAEIDIAAGAANDLAIELSPPGA